MATTAKVSEVRKVENLPKAEAFVQPTELCDTQRRSMARDAFAALQAHGF